MFLYQSVHKAEKICSFLPWQFFKIIELENTWKQYGFRRGQPEAFTAPQALFGKHLGISKHLPCYQYLNFHMQVCTNGWLHYIQWHQAVESSKSLAIPVRDCKFTFNSHENMRGMRRKAKTSTIFQERCHLWVYPPPTVPHLWVLYLFPSLMAGQPTPPNVPPPEIGPY